MGWVLLVSQVLWYWRNLGKLGSNTPNHAQGHTKNNLKAPHLTPNNVFLLCQSYLRVSYTCLRGIQTFGKLGEKGPKYSIIKGSDARKVIHILQFTSHIKLAFTLLSTSSGHWVIPILQVLGIRTILGNLAQIPSIRSRET